MKSKYQAYPEYRDSGVEWLGALPDTWNVLPIKRMSTIFNGATPKSGEPSYWDGDISWVTPADLGKTNTPYIHKGAKSISSSGYDSCGVSMVPVSAIILSSRAPIGTLGIAAKELCTNQGCKSLVVGEQYCYKYLYYALLSSARQLNLLGRGTTFLELSADKLGSYKIGVPIKNEQESIANFLDHETARIDTLIEKQRRLIKLLKEKRQAVISRAVTKGLNPDAPMRDSGVEWLGDVPEHWIVGRYKFCTSRIVVGIAEAATHAYTDAGIPIIRSTNIKEEGLDTSGLLYIKEEFAEQNNSKYLYTNDVITVRTGYPGISSVVPNFLNKSQCFTNLIATPSKKFVPDFLTEYLNSHTGKSYFELLGWGSAQKNISVPILQNLPITHPLKDEQRRIVMFVKKQRKVFCDLTEKTETQIELLKERRAALISAAVTGKIDVRDWQPPEQGEKL